MKITTDHPSSAYGVPVILDDRGRPLTYAAGVRMLRDKLQLDTSAMAAACGVSRRTVEGWEQGRIPSAAALNAMISLLNPKT